MTFDEAMAVIRDGGRVKRRDWDTFVFGPWDPCMSGLEVEPEVEETMWFQLPDTLRPGILGSEFEDDRYQPTDIDRAADDWEEEGTEMNRGTPLERVRHYFKNSGRTAHNPSLVEDVLAICDLVEPEPSVQSLPANEREIELVARLLDPQPFNRPAGYRPMTDAARIKTARNRARAAIATLDAARKVLA